MLKVNLQRIFDARGIKRSFTYLVNNGFTRPAATKLNTGQVRAVYLRDVEHLCMLFQCTPNDLFEWAPDADQKDAASLPLKELIRTQGGVNLQAVLETIPLAQLGEIEKLIKERMKK